MPIHFKCPRCSTEYRDIRREFAGKRVQCHCGEVLRLGPKHGSGADSESPLPLNETRAQGTRNSGSGSAELSRNPPVPPPHYPVDVTQIVDRDPLFGTARKPSGGNPEQSFMNPVSPEEKQRYIVTSMVPNYSSHAQPDIYNGIAATSTNVESYYQKLSQPKNTTPAALGILLGSLGALQGALFGLLTLVNAVRTFQVMGAIDPTQAAGVSDSVLIELLLLLLVLIMNLGLGIYSGLLVFGCIEELGTGQPRPEQSGTVAFIAALYLVLLILLVCFLVFIMPQQQLDTEIANRLVLASQTALNLSILGAIVGLVPLGLTVYGVLRSR